jgi:hypothetical protein
MKSIFLLAVVGLISVTANAQSITVNNNTPSTLVAGHIEAFDQGVCSGLPVYSLPALGFAPYSSSTYNIGSWSTCSCGSAPGPGPWEFRTFTVTLVSPTTAKVGSAQCIQYRQSDALGPYTVTWTDLGGGNIRVDIN